MLTDKQRRYLRGEAHALSPVVRVGRGGVSDPVVAETRRSLEAHELIKVRIEAESHAERKALAEELARATESQLAGNIGKIAILYRQHPETPRIKIPR